jgi:NADH-quinone oxidoreductase subunit M
MYFIIGIWGGARRVYAAMKFFLFTMAGSLLMFLAIIYLAIRHAGATGTWSFALEDLTRLSFTGPTQTLLFLAFALAFAVKVPCSPSTPGCRTRTPRRRPPAPSSWPACS